MTADYEHILCIAVTPLSVDNTLLCWNFDLYINSIIQPQITSQKPETRQCLFAY